MSQDLETEPRLLQLVPYSDPILREAMPKLDFPLTEAERAIIRDMKYSIQREQLKKVNAAWDAAGGMAANQWGIHKRIFLYCPESEDDCAVIINPRYEPITAVQKKYFESCFSVPLAVGYVRRYTHIRVHYQDEQGTQHTRNLSGRLAHVWQHENDHLNGFLYDDCRMGKCIEKHQFDSKEAVDAFYQKK